MAIVHDNQSFDIQWTTGNLGSDSQAFNDKLEVFHVGDRFIDCPGSDNDLGEPVYKNDNLSELPIGALQFGSLMSDTVGPFPEGSYRFTVTVNHDSSEPNESNTDNNASFNCFFIHSS